MRPRFVGRLGPADVVTVGNAVVGLLAVLAAVADPRLAARLVLLGAVADGLDGVIARRYGGTPVGPHLDSLSDVATFGVAPAVLVATIAAGEWGLDPIEPSVRGAVAVGIPAAFLAMVVVRLGFYAAFDADEVHTRGVPSTLAATIIGATVLVGVVPASAILAVTAGLAYLMSTRVGYPDLLARDAVLMGAVHVLAVAVPDALGRAFPYALLTLALAYLVLGPRFYWRSPSP